MRLIGTVIIFLLIGRPGFSQGISGTWTGGSEKSIFIVPPTKIILELAIYSDSLISGITHSYYKGGMYEHHKISGKFDRKDSSVRFTEDSIISYHANKASIFESEYKMKLTNNNGQLELRGLAIEKAKGPFRTRLKTWFVKDADSLQKPVGNVPKGQSEVSTTITTLSNDLRLPDIQKVIELSKDESDSILVDLFDNGIIDNDSVSIFLNDSLIIKNQGISDHPISFTIRFPKGAQFEKIKMVAENLGSIPPNTAALKITTRKNTYFVYLSSDFSRNAVVEFFIKE